MKRKFILFISLMILIVLSIGIISSLEYLKPAKIDHEYLILQTCSNCSFINLSVSNVNGVVLSNAEMTDNGSGVWYYAYTPETMGRYDVTGVGDIDGVFTSFATYFMVTPNGEEVSVGQSILYVVFIVIVFSLICLLFYFILIIPGNEGDKIIKLKYLRVLFIAFIYGLIIVLLNLLNGLATNLVTLTIFSGIIGFLFEVMIRISWSFTIILIIWTFYMIIHDTNINREIKKLERLGGGRV